MTNLLATGVQPENENGKLLARDDRPRQGWRILWFAQALFSIEILEQTPLDAVLRKAFSD